MLLLISFLLASCSSLPPAKPSAVVGRWEYADETQSCRYDFKKDGTFAGEVRVQARLISKFRGTWTVQDDLLLYRYVSDELGRIAPGTTDRDKLVSVERDSFLIEAANGDRRRYMRIP